jgi:hypothetical protein
MAITDLSAVMAGPVPAIHGLLHQVHVDARHKAGYDGVCGGIA